MRCLNFLPKRYNTRKAFSTLTKSHTVALNITTTFQLKAGSRDIFAERTRRKQTDKQNPHCSCNKY